MVIKLAMRCDKMKEEAVEQGLILQKQFGTRIAAKFMASFSIPLHVALRTLLMPHLRRKDIGIFASSAHL